LGLVRLWSGYRGQRLNVPALVAWTSALAVAWLANRAGLHLFFLLLPAWITATVVYIVTARVAGARESCTERVRSDLALAADRRREELAARAGREQSRASGSLPLAAKACRALAWLSLLACTLMAFAVFGGGDLQWLRNWMILPSVVYFVTATYWINAKETRS